MAAKPLAWQEKGPVSSQLDKEFNESWAQDEVGTTMSRNSPLQDKMAPRAEPEEDIDIVLEPGDQVETLPQNQTLSRTEIADATELENQESARISLCTPRKTPEMVTELGQVAQPSDASQAQQESEESIDRCEDAVLPPPLLPALSTEECCETEGYSSPDGEVAEWISDAEIILDPTEDLMSPDSQNNKEWPQTPPLSEPFNKEVDSIPGEMTENNVATEENVMQLNFLLDGFDRSETENEVSGGEAVRINLNNPSPSDRNNSDDLYTECSPPFADESEGEEEVSIDNVSCPHQCSTLDIRGESFQLLHSANVSVCTDETSLPAIPSAKQQKELVTQSQCALVPREANQEVAQQVLSQTSPPLSTVAMELSSQGGAVFQGSGCVVAGKERHSRAEESEQTGGEEEQKEGGFDSTKVAGKQQGELLAILKTVRTQKLKSEKNRFVSSKHTRMESDSCDDSQSDSGVSADFSPCSTLEGNTIITTGTPTAAPKETPIEREIRRAIEREHSLRRSRGLPNPPTSPEYVEIPLRKTVFFQSLADNPEKCQGKDRQFAGKKMQHEILEEVQREEDLVKLGKVPGFYDKGTVRQLKERKLLFEAFQTPSDSPLTVSTRSRTMSPSSASDIPTPVNKEDISLQSSTIGGSHEERSPTLSRHSMKGQGSTNQTPLGPGFSEGTSCQVIILENNLSVLAQKPHYLKPEAAVCGRPHRTEGHGEIQEREQEEEDEEAEAAPKENPFFKLRSSTSLVKVEQDIRETQEREKELHKQRISVYGGTEGTKGGGGGRRPASIDTKSPTLSPASLNGLTVTDLHGSSPRGATEPSAARQSVGKFSVWPPAQAEDEKINRPEVPHSPRALRQKNPLVQRWESGLVNGHNEEED